MATLQEKQSAYTGIDFALFLPWLIVALVIAGLKLIAFICCLEFAVAHIFSLFGRV